MTKNKSINRLEKMQNEYEVHQQKYNCTHPTYELRKRTLKNKAISYVNQCLICGKAISRGISQETAFINNSNIEPQPFNEELKANWENSRNKEAEIIFGRDDNQRELRRLEFWKCYNEYLKTPIWLKKRGLVLERAKGVCEGCGDKSAEEVHHLTYCHMGDEFLFELVAVCKACHERLHSEHLNKKIEVLELT
jgi:hypothetical protein